MAEFTNPNIVSIAAGQNVPLTETAVQGNCSIVHREGAGIITLRGLTNQCRARFRVAFGANIAIPTGGHKRRAAYRCDGDCDTGCCGKLFQHLCCGKCECPA